MDKYNEKTETLVGLFLNFSDRTYISADDFIKIRQQAVKEVNKENERYKNKVIHPLTKQNETSKEKETKSKQPSVIKSEGENSNQDTNIEKMDTEKMFLSMVKELQD